MPRSPSPSGYRDSGRRYRSPSPRRYTGGGRPHDNDRSWGSYGRQHQHDYRDRARGREDYDYDRDRRGGGGGRYVDDDRDRNRESERDRSGYYRRDRSFSRSPIRRQPPTGPSGPYGPSGSIGSPSKSRETSDPNSGPRDSDERSATPEEGQITSPVRINHGGGGMSGSTSASGSVTGPPGGGTGRPRPRSPVPIPFFRDRDRSHYDRGGPVDSRGGYDRGFQTSRYPPSGPSRDDRGPYRPSSRRSPSPHPPSRYRRSNRERDYSRSPSPSSYSYSSHSRSSPEKPPPPSSRSPRRPPPQYRGRERERDDGPSTLQYDDRSPPPRPPPSRDVTRPEVGFPSMVGPSGRIPPSGPRSDRLPPTGPRAMIDEPPLPPSAPPPRQPPITSATPSMASQSPEAPPPREITEVKTERRNPYASPIKLEDARVSPRKPQTPLGNLTPLSASERPITPVHDQARRNPYARPVPSGPSGPGAGPSSAARLSWSERKAPTGSAPSMSVSTSPSKPTIKQEPVENMDRLPTTLESHRRQSLTEPGMATAMSGSEAVFGAGGDVMMKQEEMKPMIDPAIEAERQAYLRIQAELPNVKLWSTVPKWQSDLEAHYRHLTSLQQNTMRAQSASRIAAISVADAEGERIAAGERRKIFESQLMAGSLGVASGLLSTLGA